MYHFYSWADFKLGLACKHFIRAIVAGAIVTDPDCYPMTADLFLRQKTRINMSTMHFARLYIVQVENVN